MAHPRIADSPADMYVCPDAAEVQAFLKKHEDLAPLLIEARRHIAKCFGPETPVVLAVSYDPEGESEEELLALICTSLPVAEAMKREDQFDDEWWLDHVPLAQSRLVFCLEYV